MEIKTVIVKRGQTYVDISLQEYGHTEGVAWILEDNDVQIHGAQPGDAVSIRKGQYKDKSIVQYYNNDKHTPTTK